ncbi:tRNA intron endonuclease [Auriculariales sp. MPI-PUGE-AT-0066]|nr:tRNA intron endonuclease [Auriculariales sp. MPI-PUGE-AT-0066]
MESHPVTKMLGNMLGRYPRSAGALFQVFNDLLLAQRWQNLRAIDLANVERVVVCGRQPGSDQEVYVVPCSLAEPLPLSIFHLVFQSLSQVATIHLGIVGNDSSVVYYKLSSDIVKPPM